MGKIKFNFELRISTSQFGPVYICKSDVNHTGDYYPAADYDALEAKLSEAREEIGKMDSMYQDRLLDMEARACKATEDLELCSKSYDANVKGYLEDIYDLDNKLRIARRALSDISGSGPVDLKGKHDPYAGWSWCYDRAKSALTKMGGA